jgi:Tol biopolymer transport system component
VLQVSALLSAAGIDPAKATKHLLQIKRTGSSCITSFAIYDDVLAAVTLRFGGVPRLAFLETSMVEPDHHSSDWFLKAVNQDGSAPTTLLAGTVAGDQPSGPVSWSPDARRVVYANWNQATSTADLWIANADGSGSVLVPGTSGASSPNWSPDGKKFIFVDSAGNVASINIDGTNALALTSGGGNRDSVLSPDGKRVSFVRNDAAGSAYYFVMDVNGSGQSLLGISAAYGALTWSPDSTQIAYVKSNDVGWQIMVSNSDGSGAHEIFNLPLSTTNDGNGAMTGKAMGGQPTWSPEGNQIAFVLAETLVLGPPDGITWNYLVTTHSIWLVKSDGSGLTELLHGDRTKTFGLPSWSR